MKLTSLQQATLSSVSPWRCITGCGIGPLNHRFTPKVVEKGVSAA